MDAGIKDVFCCSELKFVFRRSLCGGAFDVWWSTLYTTQFTMLRPENNKMVGQVSRDPNWPSEPTFRIVKDSALSV